MIELKLCQNCKWSEPEKNFEWNNRCFHPQVIRTDRWALSKNAKDNDRRGCGVDTGPEREKRWPRGACGMRGALYEPKEQPEQKEPQG